MKIIPLTRNQLAIVDDVDFEFLAQWRWFAGCPNKYGFYAARNREWKSQPRGLILMHRVVLERKLSTVLGNLQVDHINGNTLDNRRENLRPATSGQNKMAFRRKVPGSSKYRGVYWNKGKKRWQAQLTFNRHCYNLGRFHSEDDAAKARDAKAAELFGDYAHLNNVT